MEQLRKQKQKEQKEQKQKKLEQERGQKGPDQIDEILFEAAICQGKILQILRVNRWQPTIHHLEPNDHKLNLSDTVIIAFKKNPNLNNFSDEFYERLQDAPTYTVHQFYPLFMSFKLTKLSLDQLQELYRDTERMCDAIMLFINQKEIIADMLNNIPNTSDARYDYHLRKRQDKYISNIKTSLNTLFATFSNFSRSKLLDILQLGDKFVFVNNITRNGIDQHLDYPYQNWIDNIAELWLEYAKCYADMFEQMIDLETPKKASSVVVSSVDVPSVGPDNTLYDSSLLSKKNCLKKYYF